VRKKRSAAARVQLSKKAKEKTAATVEMQPEKKI